jgi:predicted DNA-binding transcriptional regulator AlpA
MSKSPQQAKQEQQSPPSRRAFSIPEFCESYGFSRASFYNLDAQGKAPATINIGRRRLITDSAAQAWELAMQATPSDEVPA